MDDGEKPQVIQVLFALHKGFDTVRKLRKDFQSVDVYSNARLTLLALLKFSPTLDMISTMRRVARSNVSPPEKVAWSLQARD